MDFPYTIIDLTHALHAQIPTWDGTCGFLHNCVHDYCDGDLKYPFRVMQIKMNAGIATHVDAPSHCINGGQCIDELPIDALILPCVIIDVRDKSHARYSLTLEDVLAFESELGVIPKNACVMVQTGWAQFWDTPQKYHNGHLFPSVSLEAAKHLLARGVQALGIDTLSADRPEDGFKVHQLFLGAGKILIENVAHLDKMPKLGALSMIIPLKIKGGTEAPIRLLGLVKKDQG